MLAIDYLNDLFYLIIFAVFIFPFSAATRRQQFPAFAHSRKKRTRKERSPATSKSCQFWSLLLLSYSHLISQVFFKLISRKIMSHISRFRERKNWSELNFAIFFIDLRTVSLKNNRICLPVRSFATNQISWRLLL